MIGSNPHMTRGEVNAGRTQKMPLKGQWEGGGRGRTWAGRVLAFVSTLVSGPWAALATALHRGWPAWGSSLWLGMSFWFVRLDAGLRRRGCWGCIGCGSVWLLSSPPNCPVVFQGLLSFSSNKSKRLIHVQSNSTSSAGPMDDWFGAFSNIVSYSSREFTSFFCQLR